MRHRVLITCLQLQATIDPYRPLFVEQDIEIVLPQVGQHLVERQLLGLIDGFDGMIAGDDEVTARVLQAGRRLKVVSKWGVGIDAIDRPAAQSLGIQVYNTPGVFGEEVADVVIGYLILLARQLHRLDASVRKGGWLKVRGVTLTGKTLGLVGLGTIGRAVARRAPGFGMRIVGHDRIPVPDSERAELGLHQIPFQEVLSESDFVAVALPLTPETHHLFNREAFRLMKPGARLINVGRGAIVHEPSLVEALDCGRLAGAALDVYEQEPLPAESRLRRLDNVIFGTHNASNTHEGVLRTNELAIRNLFRGLGLDGP